MTIPLESKSTVEEIRARFDHDVERFTNPETGQQAVIDAPLVLKLVAQACHRHLQAHDTVLDLGCGAGNFTLRVLQEVGPLHCHLADLSQPMLTCAEQRIRSGGAASVQTHHSDLRALTFPENSFDCILASAVLHHLREDDDWAASFARFHRWLKPGGRLYVSDLAYFDLTDVQEIMWDRYGRYLESYAGQEGRDKIFACIEQEDSPRSLPYQLDLLKSTGFARYDVLHRNGVFACYLGVK